MIRQCEVCDQTLGPDRCTNRRCGECHRAYCTSGGNTEPGHGLGYPPKQAQAKG